METAVIVALIACVGSIVGQWIIADSNRRKDEAEQAVKDAKMEMRLDAIDAKFADVTTRLDEHNSYAKRFEEVAVSLAELRTELHTRGAA